MLLKTASVLGLTFERKMLEFYSAELDASGVPQAPDTKRANQMRFIRSERDLYYDDATRQLLVLMDNKNHFVSGR